MNVLTVVIVITSSAALLTAFDSFRVAPARRREHSRLGAGRASSDATNHSGYARASRIRARRGHDAAVRRYRQLLLRNPRDTSAAARLAASDGSPGLLSRVGWPYSQLSDGTDEDWDEDIRALRDVLDCSRYRHASIREHVFNLSSGAASDEGGEAGSERFAVERYEEDYPFGPTYVRPLVAGQGLDPSKVIGMITTGSTLDDEEGPETNAWLPSLRCLAALFLLSTCVPTRFFVDSVIGGGETLNLLLRLNLVFVFDAKQQFAESGGEDCRWIVPLVHLFPLDMPTMQRSPSVIFEENYVKSDDGRNLVLMTDLHPSVLGLTSIPHLKRGQGGNDHDDEGAVMYVGPDSLALVHHLHATMPQYAEVRKDKMRRPIKGRVLDVCTGSGIQALSALALLEMLRCSGADPLAEMDSMTAVAVDINERALRFTRFNARLNGFEDKIVTVHANLLSGEVCSNADAREAKHDKCERSEGLLIEGLQRTTQEKWCIFQHTLKRELKFDLLLANPPFIPVPPETPSAARRYGLFSSGGGGGEDCLRAIVRMAPSLLRPDGGLLAIVSEFMNPPWTPSSPWVTMHGGDSTNALLSSKIEEWWGQSCPSRGNVFTNQFPLSFETYAKRRAMTGDQEDIDAWKDHLHQSGIRLISPGLLFVQTEADEARHDGVGLKLNHYFVPKTKLGSIWTPHNVEAVRFTSGVLQGLFK